MWNLRNMPRSCCKQMKICSVDCKGVGNSEMSTISAYGHLEAINGDAIGVIYVVDDQFGNRQVHDR